MKVSQPKLRFATLVLAAGFSLGAAGCAQMKTAADDAGARTKIVENLDPIQKIEERGARLTMAMQQLPLVAMVTSDDVRLMKEYYDVYFVHHGAATVSLAEGNLPAYRSHVRIASRELDSLEAKLKEVVQKAPRGATP